MRGNEAFQSNWLKAEDLQGRRVAVTIEEVTLEDLEFQNKKERKPVARFHGKEKALVLNRTNWNRLADFLGSDDSDDWTGKTIVLGVEKVDFQGKRVPAIRVLGLARPSAQSTPEPPPPEIPAEEFHAGDDDVPF
jgi:hypothetical protein